MTAKTGFEPGSHGCHEALHMASVLINMVESELIEHQAVMDSPVWMAHAKRAQEALMDLYNAIGREHLTFALTNGEHS